jgi:hypothetical protein
LAQSLASDYLHWHFLALLYYKWRQVAYSGTKLLYRPEPKPVVYIIRVPGPVKNILGRS